MKLVAWVTLLATLVASAAYMVVSLNRWEWNRALFFGLIFVAAEVAFCTALLVRKLTQLSRQLDPEVREILEGSRPSTPDRFRWLTDPSRTNVFIVFLVGGGVVLSALAWVVDHLAARTATPAAEARLAGQLAPIAYPRGGFVVGDEAALLDRR